jgi:hypothetical protein
LFLAALSGDFYPENAYRTPLMTMKTYSKNLLYIFGGFPHRIHEGRTLEKINQRKWGPM